MYTLMIVYPQDVYPEPVAVETPKDKCWLVSQNDSSHILIHMSHDRATYEVICTRGAGCGWGVWGGQGAGSSWPCVHQTLRTYRDQMRHGRNAVDTCDSHVLVVLTSMLLLANLANTKWCKIPWKWLKPWQMGTNLRVLSESYPMDTNMTVFRWFSELFASLCFGQ